MAVVYNSLGSMVGLLTLTDVLAVLYQANPENHVPIPVSHLRRQGKMFKVIKDMKNLHASINNISNLSDISRSSNSNKNNNKIGINKTQISSPTYVHSNETVNKIDSSMNINESKQVNK